MKRLIIIAILMLLGVASMMAVPAYPKPVDVKQPDGTTVTLLLRGDEFLHFSTTTDGFTVTKRADGFYCYAERDADGRLVATDVVAKNPDARSISERAFLTGRRKMVRPDMTAGQKELKERAARLYRTRQPDDVSAARGLYHDPIDYSKFKGLVVLVEFTDCQFLTDDPQQFYQRLTSEKNYTDDSKKYFSGTLTGSVRDYFFDNSMGMFDPEFDVVGPVKVDMKSTEVGGDKVTFETLAYIFKKAMTAVNSQVDFTKYDLNGDGYIDMVYFIFAGYGSNIEGNNESYMWPHAGDFTPGAQWYNLRFDGRYLGHYACGVEILDYEINKPARPNLDGIGTMCHEFSHVLGLADHYDADYEENGQAETPLDWDLMASGSYLDKGLTPAGYSAFERHQLGFAEPEYLEVAGNYELEAFAASNQFYLLKTGHQYEEFYIENRQNTGWDRCLPGHGMLVWRVDTSEPSVFTSNKVNCYADHQYLELLCATPGKALLSNYTPFPGNGGISFLTSDIEPALRAWDGSEAVLDLYDIAESADGIISFKAGKDLYETVVEDFETLALTSADVSDVKGRMCSWTLSNATVEQPANKLGNGNRVIKMSKKSTLTSSPLEKPVNNLKLKVWTGSQMVKISLRTSTDGQTWTELASSDGSTTKTLFKNSGEVTMMYNQKLPAGTSIQVMAQPLMSSSSSIAYVDDISFVLLKNDAQGIETVTKEGSAARCYNLMGQRVSGTQKGLLIKGAKKFLVR